MIRYKCIVSYCGANYAGWQRQNGVNSIQATIEDAIKIITVKDTTIVGSGRTDAKVNARGQVFHFDSDIDMSPYKWKGAINGFLPGDIHILSIEKVDDLFHSRFDVKEKKYTYRINMSEYDVFTKDTVYQYCRPLNVEKMIEASQYFLGTHDFTSYCSNSLEQMEDQTRTIYDIQFSIDQNILSITYSGNGFMRYMVRMMSGDLIEVGKGKLQPVDIQKHLEAKSKRIVQKNAPAEGLTLEHVNYFKVLAMNDTYCVHDLLIEQENNLLYLISVRKTNKTVGKIYLDENSSTITIKLLSANKIIDEENFIEDIKSSLKNKFSDIQQIVVKNLG